MKRGIRIRLPLGVVLCIFLLGFYGYIKVAASFGNLKWPFRIFWIIEFLTIFVICIWYWGHEVKKANETAQPIK